MAAGGKRKHVEEIDGWVMKEMRRQVVIVIENCEGSNWDGKCAGSAGDGRYGDDDGDARAVMG